MISKYKIVLFITLFLGVFVAYGLWGYSYDDNFITYRYAKNLLNGDGLVYNPNEFVFGSSAPGYALLLAGLSYLTQPFGLQVHHWGTMLSTSALWVTLFIFYQYLKEYKYVAFMTLLVAFVVFLSPLTHYLLGSEVILVLALISAVPYFLYIHDRPGIAGVLAAIAMCMRLDAVLAVAILGLVAWWHKRRFPVVYVVITLLALMGMLVLLSSYYGSFMPNTLKGKTAINEVPYTLRQWQMLKMALPDYGSHFLVLGALLGLFQCWKKRLFGYPVVLAMGLWLLGHEIIYRLLNVWVAPWYHFSTWVALVVLCIWAGFGSIHHLSQLRKWSFYKVEGFSIVVFSGLIIVFLLVPATKNLNNKWRKPPDARHDVYASIANDIRENSTADSRVLALEIGVLGYYSERKILDLGGLVSSQFTTAKFSNTRAELAAKLLPEYIVAFKSDANIKKMLVDFKLNEKYSLLRTMIAEDGVAINYYRLK